MTPNYVKGTFPECALYCSQSTYLAPTQTPGLTNLYPKLEKIQSNTYPFVQGSQHDQGQSSFKSKVYAETSYAHITMLSGWLPVLKENALDTTCCFHR